MIQMDHTLRRNRPKSCYSLMGRVGHLLSRHQFHLKEVCTIQMRHPWGQGDKKAPVLTSQVKVKTRRDSDRDYLWFEPFLLFE